MHSSRRSNSAMGSSNRPSPLWTGALDNGDYYSSTGSESKRLSPTRQRHSAIPTTSSYRSDPTAGLGTSSRYDPRNGGYSREGMMGASGASASSSSANGGSSRYSTSGGYDRPTTASTGRRTTDPYIDGKYSTAAAVAAAARRYISASSSSHPYGAAGSSSGRDYDHHRRDDDGSVSAARERDDVRAIRTEVSPYRDHPTTPSVPSGTFKFTPSVIPSDMRMLPDDKEAANKLFAEYLRVINNKDDEIHVLIVELEKVNLELKKKDDKFKARLRELKDALISLQATADDYKIKEKALERATKENDELKSDIDSLRATLKDSEDRMKSVLKANEKAMRLEADSRQRLQADHDAVKQEWTERLKAIQSQVVAIEAQRDTYRIRNEEEAKDALRWKIEAQRLQEEATEAQRVNRDLKKAMKEMKPTAAVEVEIAQLETRHKALVQEYEVEAERARKANKELSIKNNDYEIRQNDLQHRLDDATRQLQHFKGMTSDADVLIAQLRLEKQQTVDDMRADHQAQIKLLQQQIDTYYVDKVTSEGELAVMRQRNSDLESAANAAADRFANDEKLLQEQLSSTRLQLSDTQATLEAAQRRIQQQAAHIEQSDVAAITTQEDLRRAQAENRRNEDLKAQLIETNRAGEELRLRVRQLESQLRDKETALNETQNDLDITRRDLRTEQTRKQQEVSDLQQKIRYMEGECERAQRQVAELNVQVSLGEQKDRASNTMLQELENGMNRMKESVKDRDRTIEGLRNDIARLVKRGEELQDGLDKAHELLSVEREDKAAYHEQCGRLEGLLRQKEAVVETLNEDIRRIESAANQHEADLSRQLDQTRDRVQSLVKDLHTAQQQAGIARHEVARAEAAATDKVAELQRTVVDPLQKRIDDLQRNIGDLQKEAGGKDEKMREQNDLLTRQADLVEKLRVEVVSRDKRIAGLEEGKDAKERDVSKKQSYLEDQIRELTKQIEELRDKEIHQMQELAARRSEVGTWRERCANLESLKTIADNAVAEYKARELDMLDKIEEMQTAQQVMQTCFDKQQEQIELGKRLREQEGRKVGGY